MAYMQPSANSGFITSSKHGIRTKPLVLITSLALAGSLGMGKDAWGADGSLILTKRGGTVAAAPAAFDLTGDLGDERVVTAGLGVRTKDISSFILRSYDSHTGSLITEDEFELTVDEESAAAIDAGGGRIYAVGSGLNSDGGLSLLVRAYDAGTGKLLWEDELNPAQGSEGMTTAFEATGRFVLASEGAGQNIRPTAQSLYLVQATYAPSGKILWQDEFLTSWEREQDEGDAFSLSAPQVVALSFSISVRTYDTSTGELLWRDEFNPGELASESSEDEADFRETLPEQELDYQHRLVQNLTSTPSHAAQAKPL